MNRIVAVLLACAVSKAAFGQGLVTFNTSSASGRAIKFTFGDASNAVNVAVGNPGIIPGHGAINISAYAASLGTPLTLDSRGVPVFDASWRPTFGIGHQIAPFPGSVPTFTITTDAVLGVGGAGAFVQFIMVAWTGPAADFSSAYLTALQDGIAMLGWSGSPLSGGSLSWSQNIGTQLQPAAMVTGTGGYNGLTLSAVPEPGSIALGGLGVAALVLLRRRK